MSSAKKIILTAALMHGAGHEPGAWRVRKGPASDYVSPHFYADVARTAERGKLHALFLAEQLTNRDTGDERPTGALDTVATLSYMAAFTSHLGLVGTASTTYNEPYDVARRFATIDHLSCGRVGWNSVTTANSATAEMYGEDRHPTPEDRYARADEFIDVVVRLWESWDTDALVGDKAAGLFARSEKIHAINHKGRHFSVRGPLPFPRSIQGRPVIFQAGSSPPGRDQAARTADVVFTAQHTVESAKEFRTDIRRRAAEYGRDPEVVKVLPGIHVVLGRTMDEANRKKAAIEDARTIEQKLSGMSKRIGISVTSLREHLDRPVPVELLPPDDKLNNGLGWRNSIVSLAVKERLTVRELLSRSPGAHHHIVGTPETIADAMQERIEAGAADGFTLMVGVLPEGLNDIVELLVPELQRRGIFHEDYEHMTLRDSLGIGASRPLPSSSKARAA